MRVQLKINETSREVTNNVQKSNLSYLLLEILIFLINKGKVSIIQTTSGQSKIVSTQANENLGDLFSKRATEISSQNDPAIEKVTYDNAEIKSWLERTFKTEEAMKGLLNRVKIQQYYEFQELLKNGLREKDLVMPETDGDWKIEDFMSQSKNNDLYKPLLSEAAKTWFHNKYNGKEAAGNRNHLSKITTGLSRIVINSASGNFINSKSIDKKQEKIGFFSNFPSFKCGK